MLSVKKNSPMKILHDLALSSVLALFLCLAASCGKAEEEIPQPNSKNHIYVAEILKRDTGSIPNNFSVTEDHLYFLRYENDSKTIYRTPLSGINTENAFSESEAILTLPDILANLPENAPAYHSADILDYTTDSEQNLYCLAALYKGSINLTLTSGILYKQSPEGRLLYCTVLPNLEAPSKNANLMAADSGGRVFVLLGSSILMTDEKGEAGRNIALDSELKPDISDNFMANGLMADGEGHIYYTVENHFNFTRNTYIMDEANNFQPAKVPVLSGRLSIGLHESSHSLLVRLDDDRLYRYDQKTDSLQEILSWGDSNLIGNDVRTVTQLTEDSFLAFSQLSGQEELLLLTKTDLSQLPQKEQIVIACFFPDNELRQYASDFNRASTQYHVSIETYGADEYDEENTAAYALLNAALASKNGPDILDLPSLGFGQYAYDNILEDLYPYMGDDALINKANYSDNLLEGYTINGKLICIPKRFYFRPLCSIGSRTASVQNWTLPEIIALTERYPDAPLFDPPIYDGESILELLCTPYYLEHFVDWEAKKANFDSDEFRNMLIWIKAQAEKPVSENETGLVTIHHQLYDFINYLSIEWSYDEEVVLQGQPSADGEGCFSATACNALGILYNSRHKEGAWEFLRYFLSGDNYESGFPSRMDQLDALAEEAITPMYILDENGNRIKDSDGNDWLHPKGSIYINGEPLEFFALEQSQADAVMAAIAKIDFSPRTATENAIIKIVEQDARDFFQGRKTPEQVSAVIQSRVQTLLQESGSN